MPSPLASFLATLEKEGELKRIPSAVDAELEIPEIVQELYHQNAGAGTPALLFEKVNGSRFPLLINLLGSEKRIELLLGEKPEALSERICRTLAEAQRGDWRGRLFPWLWRQRDFIRRALRAGAKEVSSAPFQSFRREGDEVDLSQIPATKSWPLDAGRFITAGLVITKSPRSGARNVGIYRLQILSKNEIALHWQIQKGGGFHYAEAEELNQPLPVAVVIGSDPLLWLAGILPLPEGMDEIAFASFLAGRSLPMAKCRSVDLEVPASAEIVIEGLAHPGRRAMEGPFGDHFGHYSHPAPFPVLEVKSLSHRPGALFHAAVVGKPPQEDKAMGEMVTKIFAPLLRLVHPEIGDIWAYPEAGFHNLLVVSVKERYDKEALKSALGILGEGQLSLSKCILLVDADVNVRDFGAVLAAAGAHFDPEEDFTLLPGTAQDTLDFTGRKINLGSKMILDATAKGKASGPVEKAPPPGLRALDARILDARILAGTLLVMQLATSHRRPQECGGEILKKVLPRLRGTGIKIAAAVSEDVPLADDALLIWGIFTRFDCERDLLFEESRLEGARPVHRGVLGIDATWKEDYPLPVEMTEAVREKVRRRWREYGF